MDNDVEGCPTSLAQNDESAGKVRKGKDPDANPKL